MLEALSNRRWYCYSLLLAVFCSFLYFQSVFAQAPQVATPTTPSTGQQPPVGPTVDSISTTYKEPKQDPFLDPEKLIPKDKVDKGPKPIEVVPWPSYEEREADWKNRREVAKRNGTPEPTSSERYLLDELQIMGLYKKAEGQGVFIKPKPTSSTMIYATVGQKFYNGSIVRIEGSSVEFEEISKLSNGKEKVERKNIKFTRGK